MRIFRSCTAAHHPGTPKQTLTSQHPSSPSDGGWGWACLLSAQQSPSFPRVEGQYMNARNVRQNKHTTKRVSLNEQDHLAPAPPDREAVSASQCSTGDRDELEFD